jgi:hypothetical protein
MSLQDKIATSRLSLEGNGFNPQRRTSAFGYVDRTNDLNPRSSTLHNTYDTNGIPVVKPINFNKSTTPSYVPVPSKLDELDTKAPKLEIKGVVSQTYNSSANQGYKNKGPKDGRY